MGPDLTQSARMVASHKTLLCSNAGIAVVVYFKSYCIISSVFLRLSWEKHSLGDGSRIFFSSSRAKWGLDRYIGGLRKYFINIYFRGSKLGLNRVLMGPFPPLAAV